MDEQYEVELRLGPVWDQSTVTIRTDSRILLDALVAAVRTVDQARRDHALVQQSDGPGGES